jgi:RimJ/RimL family protein N-acetyltransferase
MSLTTLATERLLLRPFTDADLAPFAALNAHPQVVETLGSCSTRAQSDAMVEMITTELATEGWGFWALEVIGGAPLVGMAGLHRVSGIPCAPAVEIGWRLHPDHWGRGYATEAGRAALDHGFGPAGLSEIVSFTAATNLRSRAVMDRLGLVHEPAGDFEHPRLPEGSPLRSHVLYRITNPGHGSA